MMFWGSFSFSGVGYPVPIEGMMNLFKYIDVMNEQSFQICEGHLRKYLN